jgi:deoxyadenosine/deoxycytidine kinase
MRIVISGTVGIGKSTTAEALVNKLMEKGNDVDYLQEETVESVYLKYYYNDPAE